MYVSGDTIWAASGYEKKIQTDYFPVGGGIAYSTNGGNSWTLYPQPKDPSNVTGYIPITTDVGNITYDITKIGRTLWIGSFYGGLRKSTDLGQTWSLPNGNRGPDNYAFDSPDSLNHRVFSVISSGTDLWVGTAQGVNLSTNNGISWQNFQYDTLTNKLSGNFVVALGSQKTSTGRTLVWASCLETGFGQQRGLAYTENQGQTWTRISALEGKWTRNLAFADTIIYAATDDGIYRSSDTGISWTQLNQIRDLSTNDIIRTSDFFAVGTQSPSGLWAGSSDGLAYSSSGGTTWKILKGYRSLQAAQKEITYARPNPFSPTRGSPPGTYFVFHVPNSTVLNIRIFNVALEPVRKLVSGEFIPAETDVNWEWWDGRDDTGRMVANGVYFYRLEINGKFSWGKVAVIN
jgi:hypothetical protein